MSSRGSIRGRAVRMPKSPDWRRRSATHLLPRSRAWHEIWIDGEQQSGGEEEDEPIYGRTYMPRKFKIAVALPPHNDVDVFAHDLGFIAIEQAGRIVGYNVVVGGGMGMTHGEPDTFPRTGDVIGFCLPEQAVGCGGKSRDRAARFRRPLRPQACAAEIHHRTHGPRRVPRGAGTPAGLYAVAGPRLCLHRQWRSAGMGGRR